MDVVFKKLMCDVIEISQLSYYNEYGNEKRKVGGIN